MGALFITCRVTGLQVDTGIEMDDETFAAIPNIPMQTNCPHCAGTHVWWTRDAHMALPSPTMWIESNETNLT
jgi:hypothetical protein